MSCSLCVPPEPPATLESYELGMVEIIVDDSHLIVSIRKCDACAQYFVWVMTEVVDYEGGKDDQVRSILPLTDAEATKFRAQGEALDLLAVAKLADARQFLRVFSTRAPTPSRYQTKNFVLPHD